MCVCQGMLHLCLDRFNVKRRKTDERRKWRRRNTEKARDEPEVQMKKRERCTERRDKKLERGREGTD